jgi:hypothetical protein
MLVQDSPWVRQAEPQLPRRTDYTRNGLDQQQQDQHNCRYTARRNASTLGAACGTPQDAPGYISERRQPDEGTEGELSSGEEVFFGANIRPGSNSPDTVADKVEPLNKAFERLHTRALN